nr:hypothetical protein [uncultured Allomuricauda sp.]
MKRLLRQTQIDSLEELIQNTYGNPETLAEQLNLALEMLFYLEDNTFEKQKLLNEVAALRDIVKVLR